MSTRQSSPKSVAILALPETGVSTVYGMFDLFMAAGRDWGRHRPGRPGRAVDRSRAWSRQRARPFAAGNGVTIQPDCTFDECEPPDVVCVPELLVAPDEPLDGRFRRRNRLAQALSRRGLDDRDRVFGRTCCSPRAGLLDGRDATTHWAYCDVLQRRYPACECIRNARWW